MEREQVNELIKLIDRYGALAKQFGKLENEKSKIELEIKQLEKEAKAIAKRMGILLYEGQIISVNRI